MKHQFFKTLLKTISSPFKTEKMWLEECQLVKKACIEGDIEKFKKYYHPKNERIRLDFPALLDTVVSSGNMNMFKAFVDTKELLDNPPTTIHTSQEDTLWFNTIGVLKTTVRKKQFEMLKYILDIKDFSKYSRKNIILHDCLNTAITNDSVDIVSYILSDKFNFGWESHPSKYSFIMTAIHSDSQKVVDYLLYEKKEPLNDKFWSYVNKNQQNYSTQDSEKIQSFISKVEKRDLFFSLDNKLVSEKIAIKKNKL